MSKDSQSPAAIIPSATILLLRDGAQGLEVFMVVRHHQIDFASGALVFPGGKADPNDFDPALRPLTVGGAADNSMHAIEVSGIREAFEECGVLLARNSADPAAPLISGEALAPLEAYREQLNNGDISLTNFLQTHSLSLAADKLVHFAHWITPEMMPKRFDTHFYLATAPADQLAIHDGYESVDSVWIQPAQAVAEAESGKRTIIFPTLRNLEKLARFQSVAQALETTQSESVVTVLPWTERRDDGTYLCIPDNAGYDHCEEKMPERKPA